TVMVDMSGSFNGYQTDMTRVWRLGEISALALRAHECSRSILRECEKMGRPGVKVAELYDKAIEIAKGEGFDKYFMGHRQQAPFIGHGIGIELNELPVVTSRSRDVLALNMTIALEPKFVIPGVGAVGVENTYVVTDNGLKALTVFPEEIQEL
ncbi:MAG: aminopeptidase P family protein, partial [Muribaculaceae bacterium]|nr:aminopeptidase P family protein [Muribaculaceae bacterium]